MEAYKRSVRVYQDSSGNWFLMRCANDLPICGVLIPIGDETTIREDAEYLFGKSIPPRVITVDALRAAKWSVGKEPLIDIEWPDGRFVRSVTGEGTPSYISSWEVTEQDT